MHDQMFAKANDKNNLGELITKLKDHNFVFEYLTSYPENLTPTLSKGEGVQRGRS